MKKILYVCYFLTAVVESYVHKCRIEKEAEATLMVYKSFKRKTRLNEVFDKVIYADDAYEYHYLDNEKIIEEGIIRYYDTVFAENGIGLDEFDEIYLSFDMLCDMGIYCGFKKKKYQLFEYFINQLTDNRWKLYEWHILHENVHGSSAYFKVAEKFQSICGLSPYCIRKWTHTKSDKEKYPYSNYIEYDFIKEQMELMDYEKEILIDCFDSTEIGIREYCSRANNTILLLTQRQWQYPVTEKETGVLYQYFVDYFLGGINRKAQVSVKPHPSDKWNHEDFFENVVVFPVAYPADLFPIIDGFTVQAATSVSSTAIEKLEYWCDNLYSMGTIYFRMWRDIHKYYFVFKIIELLRLQDEKIFRNHIPEGDNFLKCIRDRCFSGSFLETERRSLAAPFEGVAIVGDIIFDEYLKEEQYYNMLENLSEKSIIVYMDLHGNRNFLDYPHVELSKNIISLEISKEKVKGKVFAGDESEYLYVYTKNKHYQRKLQEMTCEIELYNTGLALNLHKAAELSIENEIIRKYIDSLTETINGHRKEMELLKAKVRVLEGLIQ